jgi:hypothetical protein
VAQEATWIYYSDLVVHPLDHFISIPDIFRAMPCRLLLGTQISPKYRGIDCVRVLVRWRHLCLDEAQSFLRRPELELDGGGEELLGAGLVCLVVWLLELDALEPLGALGPALDPGDDIGVVVWGFRLALLDEEELALRLGNDLVGTWLEVAEELGVLVRRDGDLDGQDKGEVLGSEGHGGQVFV